MEIVVCIKQVPDAQDIQWTSNNTMKREGVEGVINPCDLYALEMALEQKRKNSNTKITVISMGPNQAEKALRQAIALGADTGYLVCDKKFSGSDTLATGLTLSRAIQKAVPDFNIILCGQFASDGDTAQTGVQIAENLNAFQITYTDDILEITDDYVIAKQDCEKFFQKIKAPLPCVICVNENKGKKLSDALITGQMKARDAKINILNIDDLGLEDIQTGIKGSPTYVSNVFRPKHTRKCEIIEENNVKTFINNILNEDRNI